MHLLAMAACLSPSLAAGNTHDWWRETAFDKPTMPDTKLPEQPWNASPDSPPDGSMVATTTSADPTAMSLAATIRRGLAINPSVRAALSEAESAGTEVDIAEWGYYPEVDLSVGPEEFPFSEWGYDASARQMLYDWGRVRSQVENADAAEREARRAVGVAEEEAALDIAETYLDVLATGQRVALSRGYVEDLDDLLRLTEDRGRDGYTDNTERGRVALDLAQARDELATARGELSDARRQFRVLVGVTPMPGQLETPDPFSFTDRLETAPLDEWIVNAPLYRQELASAEQAAAELEEARAALRPQLNLEGSLQRRQIGGDLQNDSVIGFRLRMDTLQGLANFQRPEAARQRLEAARYRVDEQRREIRRSVLTLIENAGVYRQREKALTDQVEEAESVGQLYADQFSVGRRDINDLLTIRQEAYNARRQLIDLQSQQKRIQYRAASQLGLISPLVNGRMDGQMP